MKTKTILAALGIIAVTSLFGQETEKMKVCIKINDNKDGIITQIDTCYEGNSQSDIDAFLKSMGMSDQLEIVDPNDRSKKTMIIRHQNKSMPQGEQDIEIRIDENGNVETFSEDSLIIIKNFDLDGKNREEEMKLIEEELKILTEDFKKESGKNGEMNREIRIIVTKQIEVKSLSSDDKDAMPKSLKKANGNEFDKLTLTPNPSRDFINIQYQNDSKSPLKIKIYDLKGQLITEEEKTVIDQQMNIQMDLSKLQKGVYFLHLEQGKKSEVRKIVISE